MQTQTKAPFPFRWINIDIFRSPNRSPVVVNGNAPPSLWVSTTPGFADQHGMKLDRVKQLDTEAGSVQLPNASPHGAAACGTRARRFARPRGIIAAKPKRWRALLRAGRTLARRGISRRGAAGKSRSPRPPPRWEIAAPGVVFGAWLARGCFLIIIFSAFFVQVAKKQCYSWATTVFHNHA